MAAELARAVGLDGDASLVLKIAKGYDITTLSRATVDAYAKLTGRTDVAKLNDAEALAILDQLAQEPRMHRRYCDYYAYVFFVARRAGARPGGSRSAVEPRPARTGG